VYFRTSNDLLVVGTQKPCDYIFVLGKQILQQSYQGRSSILILRPSEKACTCGFTLKVFRASEAISKFGSSTYSKNSSKLPDSNMYLKEHFKIKCMKFTFRKPSAILEVCLKFSTEQKSSFSE
jgi:hypothetical protein